MPEKRGLIQPTKAKKGAVFITGANRGIRLALARNFTDADFNVIGTARKPEQAVRP